MQKGKVGKAWYRQLKPGDLAVYLLVAIISISMLAAAPSVMLRASGGGLDLHAVISVDTEVIRTISEQELIDGGSWSFTSYGFHYKVDYADGRVRISEADCPDLVCVQTGWLSRGGQMAACVPGHVLLRLEGSLGGQQGNDNLPDVVVR